eukprot:scaffold325499_cov38-Prasinocladus_malaysianus.AAC.1
MRQLHSLIEKEQTLLWARPPDWDEDGDSSMDRVFYHTPPGSGASPGTPVWAYRRASPKSSPRPKPSPELCAL